MILNVIILILIGVIGFFHYVQGFFSATISAILAIIAAVLAVSYQETLIDMLLKGKMADEANAMTLCVLFAAIYITLRLIFDKAIPGNLRFPAILDKVGAGAMGIVAGIFTTGIIAIAAQSLPFGPSVGGYSRYVLRNDENVTVPTNRQQQDSVIYNEMNDESLDPDKEKSLMIPVDDIVLGTVQHLSDGGTLAGDRTLSSIHPDYIQELFGDRIGIQIGANHSAYGANGASAISVTGLYSVSQLRTADPEFKELRSDRQIKPVTLPGPGQILLIVRIAVDRNAADDVDKLFRFSTGSIRLVANDKNYFPIGTVDNADLLMSQKPDDFLFLDFGTSGSQSVDAAFLIDRDDLMGDAKATTIPAGRFIEVKRSGRVDLSGKTINTDYSPSPDVNVLRKKIQMDRIHAAPTPALPSTPRASIPAPAPRPAPIENPPPQPPVAQTPPQTSASSAAQVSPQLPYKIGVNTSDGEAQNVAVAGGTVSLKDSRLDLVKIDPTATLDKLAVGDSQLTELYVPDGKKIVQVPTRASAGTSPPKLVDASGNSIAASGYFCLASPAGKQGLFMRFDAEHGVDSVSVPSGGGEVTYVFLVPSNTQLKQMTIGDLQAPVNLNVP